MSQRETGRVGQVKEVTSLANPLVKDIKALALKKFRDQQNAFMAEGLAGHRCARSRLGNPHAGVRQGRARQCGGREGGCPHGGGGGTVLEV